MAQENFKRATITTPLFVMYTRPSCFSDRSASGALLEDDPRMMGESPLRNTISGIVLFNLGLSYHLRAMSQPFTDLQLRIVISAVDKTKGTDAA